MDHSHYKTIKYYKWVFLCSTIYLITCLHHDIERQNLMRDVKIDQMLFFRDWLPYSKKKTSNVWHTHTFTYIRALRIVYEPLNPHKRIKSYWVRSSSCGVLTLKANYVYIETYILSINWGCFFLSSLYFFHIGGSMVFFFLAFYLFNERLCCFVKRIWLVVRVSAQKYITITTPTNDWHTLVLLGFFSIYF